MGGVLKVVAMAKEAPNFSGSYPLDGAQLGPAWRAAWALLSDGQWHSKIEIEPVMCEAGPIVPITALNLLRQARRAGVLETRRTVRPDRGCGPSDYRIKGSGS
jgi:hypothetical protein